MRVAEPPRERSRGVRAKAVRAKAGVQRPAAGKVSSAADVPGAPEASLHQLRAAARHVDREVTRLNARLLPLLVRPDAKATEIWSEGVFQPLHWALAEHCSLADLARARRASHSMKRLCEAALGCARYLVHDGSSHEWYRVAFFLKRYAPQALLSAPRTNWHEFGPVGLAAVSSACPSLRLHEVVTTRASLCAVLSRSPHVFERLASLSLVGRVIWRPAGACCPPPGCLLPPPLAAAGASSSTSSSAVGATSHAPVQPQHGVAPPPSGYTPSCSFHGSASRLLLHTMHALGVGASRLRMLRIDPSSLEPPLSIGVSEMASQPLCQPSPQP